MRAAIYVRISKDVRGESLGVQRQESECRALAEKMGWDVSDVYVDNDLSATTGVRRPQYERLLVDMKEKRVGAVIAWHVDRLYRQPHELEVLIPIADEAGVVFSTCRAGEIDLSTSAGRLVARLLGAVARHEIELKSERQRAQKRQSALAGNPNMGGARPFGWKEDRKTVEPFEADVIRRMSGMILAGETLNAVVDMLHDDEVPTPRGGTRWSLISARRILTNPRTAGIASYRGEPVGPGLWEPILSEDEWRRLSERFARTKAARGVQRNSGVALLSSSMLRCGICKYGLSTSTGERVAGPVRIYTCRDKYVAGKPGHRKSCGKISVTAEYLEDDIAERVIARTLRKSSQKAMGDAVAMVDKSADDPVRVLAELEGRLRQVGVDYAEGLLGRPEFLSARGRLTELIEVERRNVKVTNEPTVPAGSAAELVAWWEGATLSQRKALVGWHVLEVVVSGHTPALQRYDQRRVTVTWR